ncbi:MAG: cyclic-di-AMP receptor [Anaerolineae bacterium]|nr:cyclic-di-AMP receptor [Thermoflexus sp.]MDW8065594.1 cyclic-di-AMP receptor [Anaerolineae bacterium]
MKLILAVLPEKAAMLASDQLVAQGYRVTHLASTGGFLRRGNTTLLIGAEDDQVEIVLRLLREARHQIRGDLGGIAIVLNVTGFERF